MTNSCCVTLEAVGLEVLRPNTEAYETRDASYFSVSAQLSPYCIVQPNYTTDVALVVNTLKKTTCKWAVRGGGHITWAGASNR
ncbi:6-hydroxy-D-nicotine oxidase [Colletotrichum tofieldiae]|nr:6-hydroxy-D-nicotine oxidase [Colletotrichum tofieldiae]GKT90109.1 6-hydroxy-D-nicotine oxidase [Colletotrichum tofieldiae]